MKVIEGGLRSDGVHQNESLSILHIQVPHGSKLLLQGGSKTDHKSTWKPLKPLSHGQLNPNLINYNHMNTCMATGKFKMMSEELRTWASEASPLSCVDRSCNGYIRTYVYVCGNKHTYIRLKPLYSRFAYCIRIIGETWPPLLVTNFRG